MVRKAMSFVVTLIPPPGATAPDIREYIRESVASNKGQYRPEDPIFELDPRSVVVRHAARGKKKP
jgi:hypothetical protein